MFTRSFWLQTAERAVKTAAQAVLVVWGVGDRVLNVLTLDWRLGLGVAAGGALLSVLTSLVSAGVGPSDTPSVVDVVGAGQDDDGGRHALSEDHPHA